MGISVGIAGIGQTAQVWHEGKSMDMREDYLNLGKYEDVRSLSTDQFVYAMESFGDWSQMCACY